ncbi:hypothetical protein LMG27952_04763 [Paraburkholderia hiiakae]|uniref:Uncharacterized protein n=1 Tax=Paraburkholderia hiiakae TaxID=1081782 RepID=A0ABM8NXY6_9BURK|nr:hypothetical protein LMG27952_04763 [Paraburkholderia hiiakae]
MSAIYGLRKRSQSDGLDVIQIDRSAPIINNAAIQAMSQ